MTREQIRLGTGGEAVPAGQAVGGGDAGRDQQRLCHSGVAEGVRVGLGAMAQQVDARSLREPREGLLHTGQLTPGAQEAGLLGPLAGADDREHGKPPGERRGRPAREAERADRGETAGPPITGMDGPTG